MKNPPEANRAGSANFVAAKLGSKPAAQYADDSQAEAQKRQGCARVGYPGLAPNSVEFKIGETRLSHIVAPSAIEGTGFEQPDKVVRVTLSIADVHGDSGCDVVAPECGIQNAPRAIDWRAAPDTAVYHDVEEASLAAGGFLAYFYPSRKTAEGLTI